MHAETLGPDHETTVVLLHGGTGTGQYHWGRVGKRLAQTYAIHLPDLPGHGRTPLPDDGRYDRGVLVDAVHAYLEEVGTPAHVVGFSMGGHASLALAASEPGLFASLALIGVSVRDHDGLAGWRENFDPDVLEARYPLWASTLSRIHKPLGGAEAWKDVCRRDAGGLDVEVDVDALAALDCPVLLVRGDRDPAVDPAQYAELREVWGDQAEEFVIPAGGHDVQMTRHEVLAPGLRDYLARVTA